MVIDEPVATPGILQERQRAELEEVNDRGQVLLSIKHIGQSTFRILVWTDETDYVDEKYRAMFPFEKFNPMQSKALDDVSR